MAKYRNIDQYIKAHQHSFAHPILTELRRLINDTLPVIEENIKWGAPSFEYNGLMLGMVAFKEFVALWFHWGAELNDPTSLLCASSEETKTMRKVVIQDLDQIDLKALKLLLIEAWEFNHSEAPKPIRRRDPQALHSPLLAKALKENTKLQIAFDALPPFKRKEYVAYIMSAKRETTKENRLNKSVKLILAGIGLNDKYRKS